MKRYATFHTCPECTRILSIPETVERFCERCAKTVVPETVTEETGPATRKAVKVAA